MKCQIRDGLKVSGFRLQMSRLSAVWLGWTSSNSKGFVAGECRRITAVNLPDLNDVKWLNGMHMCWGFICPLRIPVIKGWDEMS